MFIIELTRPTFTEVGSKCLSLDKTDIYRGKQQVFTVELTTPAEVLQQVLITELTSPTPDGTGVGKQLFV